MQDTIKKIEAKINEIKAILSILGMWGKVKDQGIDTDSVLSFGFDPALVPEDELKRLAITNPSFNKTNPYNWETRDVDGTLKITTKMYNYVRLKNGEKVPLKQPVTSPPVPTSDFCKSSLPINRPKSIFANPACHQPVVETPVVELIFCKSSLSPPGLRASQVIFANRKPACTPACP